MPRRKKEDEIPLSERKGPPRCAANARERTRMRVLSKAFGRLKLTLPWVPPDTKLSKLDTLRLATSYISHLQKVLVEDGGDEWDLKNVSSDKSMAHKMDLRCWPYGHQTTTPGPEKEQKDKQADHLVECRLKSSHSSPRRCPGSSHSDEFSMALAYDGYYDYCLNPNTPVVHSCQQTNECKNISADYFSMGM